MNSNNLFQKIQIATKLINEAEESTKLEGLETLRQILKASDSQLYSLGYNHVIFKELIKMSQFESGLCLERTLDILQDNFFNVPEKHDELAEVLIYRVARSTDFQVCRACLEKISILIDNVDLKIAKHSKQLLRLADLNDMRDLNPLISEILTKMKEKLPVRRKL